ncbi:2-amino-4-hydroxy-6-hydroxymethyldihydropteridine diphosphokinase [Roseiarcaceae bacterium H3SJ34-1]|uniref:2-amino-4-hydroxy-6- hydroxymethyldihydropteridine diphosphokinase n=1 Tax=Terripilifer ovatus TaxID=3032367 RepID=UPI003AB97AA1|nr:2-amino-4-hydroxy-6-hydroxymethyldihydropteridine diphosphokinase [Roseiarcaceae bacterium H3SJ34-1]
MASADEVLAALSLGGNVGDVPQAFIKALARLAAAGAEIAACSSVWRTPPWGKTDQPDFFNIAVLVRTSLDPRALLALCLDIEKSAGRSRAERYGPRTLDIDILTYGDEVIDEPGLTIPHPRMLERAFVLVPLSEIAPEMQVEDAKISEALKSLAITGLKIDEAATALITAAGFSRSPHPEEPA